MAQLTDLNVSPYYDDFSKDKDFHRVLFRPGFAVQARELTTLQSILQNQVEQHGNHMFKEGTVVIPGQLSIMKQFQTVQLDGTFSNETVNPSSYYNQTNNVVITGQISGVTAKVIGFQIATSTTQPMLYVQYVNTGTDGVSQRFVNGENITANAGITHTTSYASNNASGTIFSPIDGTTATQDGLAVELQEGVYYVRGQFVRCAAQRLVLSTNSNAVTARVGFSITETLSTPEIDTSLTDNATGSSNYAAKGAHRLKITLTLDSRTTSSTADSNFVELMRIENGTMVGQARVTEYDVLGDTLARRTFDESGSYTVRPFNFDMRESTNITARNTNYQGVFAGKTTTDDGGTPDESLLSLHVSPGKAYVKGYELEKISPTFKDLPKARDFNSVNTGVVTHEIGNFCQITNIFGQPDITFISGESTAYKTIGLFDDKIVTNGTSSGNQIGVARGKAIEYRTGVVGTSAAVYDLYLWDVRPFTKLTLSGTPSGTLLANHASGGVQVTGVTSAATGYVFASGTGSGKVVLTTVVGTFAVGEKIKASDSGEANKIVENVANADLTITEVVTHTFKDCRSIFMDDTDSGQDFTADAVLIPSEISTGQIVFNASDANGADSNDNIVLEEDNSTTIALEVEKIATLQNTEKNISIFKLPKRVIKTLLTTSNNGATDTSLTVRRQFIGTCSSSGAVSFTAGSNETFAAFAEKDYTLSILTAGAGSGVQGQIVSVDGNIAGTGTASITVTDNTVLGNGAKVKITATIFKSNVNQRIKTTNLMKQVKVVTGGTDAFGTRPGDKEISLGRADAFKLVAVYDSETTDDAVAPQMTITATVGNFTRGEIIRGKLSGAVARNISTSSPIQYVLIQGVGATDFTSGEIVTGDSSGATATVGTISAGDKVITSNYVLDTGQRDNFYDISRIVRKVGVSSPRGKLLVVYDFFGHGAGEFFSVDSYSDASAQMGYGNIPSYTATRVDPDEPEPTGLFPLTDSIDFRPTVENIAGTSESVAAVDEITGNSFDFFSRQYDGTGASPIDTPKPASNVSIDFEYYLGRMALIFLDDQGSFRIQNGVSAERPQEPKPLENALKLATITLNPYTFTPEDAIIVRHKTQRFTMTDIGRLKKRLETVEYYTALSLLERDAESFEITDKNGLNRFKSGFVVDNFGGHRVGDAKHQDYKIAVDQENNELRPKCVMRNAKLSESVSTDAERSAANYQKTGDLITLPYTSVAFTDNPYATRVENVQPHLVYQWVGQVVLSPSGDEWFETELTPPLIVNVEGNYDTILAGVGNALGTIWNSWETQWSGVVATRTDGWRNNNFDVTRTIQTTRTDLRRTGLTTNVVEQIDEESQGTKVISRAMIPWLRANAVEFEGKAFKPKTRVYAFFDGVDVSKFITPKNTNFTTAVTPIAGSPLFTDAVGSVEGTFGIPESRFAGQGSNPRFKTGELEFRLTASDTNTKIPLPITAGQSIYSAKGILETEQETIIATRNAIVVQQGVSQTTSRNSTSTTTSRSMRPDEGDDGNSGDPLAQTIMINHDGLKDTGCFLTKIDLYFQKKDTDLPVWIEVRNVVNGYPGGKILPFGRKVLNSSEVNVSDNATTATQFTFDSPVFLKPSVEYCFVVQTASLDYLMWISQLGELDVSGSNRVVSKQPSLGVLFKSQNNRAWSPTPMQDAKFTMYRAKFDFANKGNVTLHNTGLDSKRLKPNPITLTNSSAIAIIKHQDHGMYQSTNNVTVTGVDSGIETTLNTALTAEDTTVVLASSSNFPSSGTVFLKIGSEILSGSISGTNVTSVTRGVEGTATVHNAGVVIELYMIHSVPLTEINKTHTAIANIGLNTFTVALSTNAAIDGDSTTADVGGVSVFATENYRFELMKPVVSTLELPRTKIVANSRTTSSRSPSGSESSFIITAAGNEQQVSLNENFKFDSTRMIASTVNETNEMDATKSTFLTLGMTSDTDTLSPVVDLDRASIVCVANSINNIDSSSDVHPTTDYNPMTSPEGDQNAAIYITKKVALENPATALKVIFAAHRHSSAEIKVLFKVLRTDDASDFDEIAFDFFNTDGSPDSTVGASLDDDDFQEYKYTAGVTDDGIGEPLPSFIQFAIKVVIQGTNAAEPPRLKDFRALALAT